MQVRKEKLNMVRAVYEGEIKTGAEGSIIVPDVKPDILKVLQVDAEAFLCEKYIDDGKVTVKGKVRVNVLYLPEGGECCVQSINGCFEFCETLKRSEFTPDMQLVVCCQAEKAGYKLLNSRKVGINSQILLGIQVLGGNCCDCVCDVEEETAQVRYDNVNMCMAGDYREFTFNMEENLEFPAAKCGISEILKTNVMIFNKEYKALCGKLVVKGTANACILYLDENMRCDSGEFEIPFTEVFDMEELAEDSECDVNYEVGETDFSLVPDGNGEVRCVAMNLCITAGVRVQLKKSCQAVADCYFTDSGCSVSCEEIETENIVDRPRFSAIIKELVAKGDGMPDIESVYSAVAKPYITSSQIQNGRIAVSGKLVLYVLYTTKNPQLPVCSINEEIPFSYMIDCENAERDCRVALSCECEHISYTLSSDSSVDIRCGIAICGDVIKKSSAYIITGLERTDVQKQDSAVVIYFVKSGDTLWDIAKRYRVRPESILAINSLSEDSGIKRGDKLLIPVN